MRERHWLAIAWAITFGAFLALGQVSLSSNRTAYANATGVSGSAMAPGSVQTGQTAGQTAGQTLNNQTNSQATTTNQAIAPGSQPAGTINIGPASRPAGMINTNPGSRPAGSLAPAQSGIAPSGIDPQNGSRGSATGLRANGPIVPYAPVNPPMNPNVRSTPIGPAATPTPY